MSLVRRIARGAGLKPQASAEQIVEVLLDGMLQLDSESGEVVSVEKSLGLPAVFKAIRLISETAGGLPLITYRRNGDERSRATSHPSYALLHESPNEQMTAAEFWTMLFAHLEGWGRMFIGKQFVGGTLSALHPIEPGRVRVERLANGSLAFHEQLSTGNQRTWSQREVLYVRLFTLDGVTGLSPIGMLRETMGLGIAMRKHGARFFRDLAIPAGALEVEQEIKDPKTRERIRQEWKARHHGKREIALLDAGAKFNPISVPIKDAQFVELWGATRADIADAFNMPASLLNGSTGDSLTYGNREADMQQFLTFTLHNPLKKVEQALSRDRDLFPQVNTHFCEFLREDLLRPDSRARSIFYRAALDPKTGWMQRAEVRRLENLPAEQLGQLPAGAVESALAATNGHHEEVPT